MECWIDGSGDCPIEVWFGSVVESMQSCWSDATRNRGLGNAGIGVSAYRRIGVSAYRRIGVSAYRRIGVSAYRRIGVSAYRRIGVSAYRRIGVSAAATVPRKSSASRRECVERGGSKETEHWV